MDAPGRDQSSWGHVRRAGHALCIGRWQTRGGSNEDGKQTAHVGVLQRSGAYRIHTFTPYAPWGRRVLLRDELLGPCPWVHSPLRKDPRSAAPGVGRRRPCPVRQEDRALTQSARLHVRPSKTPSRTHPGPGWWHVQSTPAGTRRRLPKGQLGASPLSATGLFWGTVPCTLSGHGV